jgi:outer membrane protein assembly factor BamB
MMAENEMYQDAPPSWLAAFDKRSGETIWRSTPAEAHDSYGTPLVVEGRSGAELVTGSWHHVAAYDGSTGERAWALPNTMEQVVASMARAGDLAAVTGGAHNEKTLTVFRLPGAERAEPEVLWETNRGVATVCSPVFYDGRLFTLTDGGIMTAYRAETGEVLWKSRLDGDHFASLLAGDGMVYATNATGGTSVIAAADEFELLAFNELDDRVYASPAVGGGCLLIRTASELFCIESDEPGRSGSEQSGEPEEGVDPISATDESAPEDA